HRASPFLSISVHVDNRWIEEQVRLGSNLVGCSVVDSEVPRPAADIDSQGLPREGMLEDPLAQITREEQCVGSTGPEGREHPKLSHADVLGLVNYNEIERALSRGLQGLGHTSEHGRPGQ